MTREPMVVKSVGVTVHHENFEGEDAYKHANFFWGIALNTLKNLLEQ